MGNLKIEQLLEFMVKHDASDIYLAYEAPPMYRIEGITQPAGKHKLTMEDTEDLANQMMNAKQKKALFGNTASSIGEAPMKIQLRHIGNCMKADPAYGKGVAKALKIPMSKIPK